MTTTPRPGQPEYGGRAGQGPSAPGFDGSEQTGRLGGGEFGGPRVYGGGTYGDATSSGGTDRGGTDYSATHVGGAYGRDAYGDSTYSGGPNRDGTDYGATYGRGTYGDGTYGGGANRGGTDHGATFGRGTYGGGADHGGTNHGATYAGGAYGGGTYGGGTYGGGSAQPYGFEPSPTPPVPGRSRKRTLVTVIAVVAVALLGLATWGGIALFGMFGGARSAQGAAEKFLTSMTSLDFVGSVLSLAPSETEMFKDAAQHLTANDYGRPEEPSEIPSLKDALDHVKSAIDVTIEGLDYETERVVDEVEVVTLTAGTITVDGDRAKVADALAEVGAAITYEMAIAGGATESEAIDAGADALHDTDISVELPYTYDIQHGGSDGSAPLPGGVHFVTVREGSGWYVSGIMTAAQMIYSSALADGVGAGDLPKLPADSLAAPAPAESPEDAGLALVERFTEIAAAPKSQSKQDAFAGTFITPERRLLSLYLLPLLQAALGGSSGADLVQVEVDGGFTSINGHGETMVLPDQLELTTRSPDSVVVLDGYCVQTDGNPRSCLTDWRGFSKLGLDELGLVVRQEHGGWVVSVTHTIGLVTRVAADHYLELRDSGRLDELVG